jgi:hypothetical protein
MRYFALYNDKRPHQALENQTSNLFHTSSVSGAAIQLLLCLGGLLIKICGYRADVYL